MKAFFSKLINRIPEFSQKNYALASKICAGLLVAVGIFFIYEMFTVGDFGIAVNWNFFTSAWFWPLFVIGFVLAIVFWASLVIGAVSLMMYMRILMATRLPNAMMMS